MDKMVDMEANFLARYLWSLFEEIARGLLDSCPIQHVFPAITVLF